MKVLSIKSFLLASIKLNDIYLERIGRREKRITSKSAECEIARCQIVNLIPRGVKTLQYATGFYDDGIWRDEGVITAFGLIKGVKPSNKKVYYFVNGAYFSKKIRLRTLKSF